MNVRSRFLFLAVLVFSLCGCSAERAEEGKTAEMKGIVEIENSKDVQEHIEKGYGLPISATERKEAEDDCRKQMELISDIYAKADKGDSLNVVLSIETLEKMVEILKETGCSVKVSDTYYGMENHEKFEDFLNSCIAGEQGEAVIYQVHGSGGVAREKYVFDGENMYVLAFGYVWNKENEVVNSYMSHTRLKEWRYTENGWFCYELCVPEYPEVTEIMDGSCLIRVEPMNQKNREMSEMCVLGIGYQGNNLLCSNWNENHMDELDYNGLYEYLYAMKYHKQIYAENYSGGIPKEEFETLIMEYLPISEENLQKYAEFDEEAKMYAWAPLGCGNYAPNFFGTSVPEVVDVRENPDGTVTLTVNAVCDMVICDDALITHDLTVKFKEDGSFQYLGNEIRKEDRNNVPEYQYRVKGEIKNGS